jgi:hypothetical protein
MKKKSWKNPVLRPAKASTMNVEGDFGKFTDFMRKVVQIQPAKNKPKASSSSHAPAV